MSLNAYKGIRYTQRKKVTPSKKRILLIEDLRSLSNAIKKMLVSQAGCEVVTAHNLAEAIAAIEAEEKDFFLAISDLSLPDASNAEIIDVLASKGLPTIAVTANVNAQTIEQVRQKGVIDYVLKNSINAYYYVTDLVKRLKSNANKTALIVGDSASENNKIALMLSRQFLEVETESSPHKVLSHLDKNPDLKLLVINFRARHFDPAELVAEIRKQYDMRTHAVIVISRFMDGPLPEISLKLGANDFMTVPFSDAEFITRVNHQMDLQDSHASLQFLAYHDELTGIPNRRAFFEKARYLHREAQVLGKPLTLMMIDIDHFKQINDKNGHELGDVVLKNFAIHLSTIFEHDVFARIGGEEFVVISKAIDTASQKAQQLIDLVNQQFVTHNNQTCQYTISVGLTTKLSSSVDLMIKEADQLLYRAKSSGRNRLVKD